MRIYIIATCISLCLINHLYPSEQKQNAYVKLHDKSKVLGTGVDNRDVTVDNIRALLNKAKYSDNVSDEVPYGQNVLERRVVVTHRPEMICWCWPKQSKTVYAYSEHIRSSQSKDGVKAHANFKISL